MGRRRRRSPEVEAALNNLKREVAGNLRRRGPGASPGPGLHNWSSTVPGDQRPDQGPYAGPPSDGPMVERMLEIASRRRRRGQPGGPGGGSGGGPAAGGGGKQS